ncbi:hypothetical protein KVV02_003331 [Mortierella alpina]|uniref:Ndc10 domain-containing protein n=1 Tax=Mortierella alpina TaxID=64518 RepID=A0A9P8CU63_MORAP|nr:hypothetical protein KVV02_003331 [Mortierella alpina]
MPGRFAFKEFSSGAHYATVKALFNAVGVVSKKKTHVSRGTGSRHAQDAGADIASIENHGGWGKGRVSIHYLSRISDDVPSKMAGCTLPGERLWLARGTILPPVALQRMLFPFVEDFAERTESPSDWLQWTENLIMDKNMYDNRPVEARIKITGKDVRYVRMLFLLTHLRKVLLQDAVDLMQLLDAPFRYEDHGVFRHPVFSLENPPFRKFREDLSNNMRVVKSPMEDSLLANAPAIHNEFRTVHSAVQRLDHTLQANTDAIQQLTKLADNVVQQITSKVTPDGQSLDRVYEFMERMGELMEKMGGNMIRTARRERRCPQVQQQQQQQQGHPGQQGQPEQQGQPKEQQPPEQGPIHRGQGHTEPQGPIEPAVAMVSRGLTWEERLVALETQLASRYAQIPPRNVCDVDPTMLP